MNGSTVSLKSYIESNGRLSQQEMLRLIVPVVEYVANMHSNQESPIEISLDTIVVDIIDGEYTAHLESPSSSDYFDSQRDVESLAQMMLLCVSGTDNTTDTKTYRSLNLNLQQTIYNINHAHELGMTWDAMQLLSALAKVYKPAKQSTVDNPVTPPAFVAPNAPVSNPIPPKKNSHGTLIIILLLLLLAGGIAFGIYYYINNYADESSRNDNDQEEEYVDTQSESNTDFFTNQPAEEPIYEEPLYEEPVATVTSDSYDMVFNELSPNSRVRHIRNENGLDFYFNEFGDWTNPNYSDASYTDRSWNTDYEGKRTEEYYTNKKSGERGAMYYSWSDGRVYSISDYTAGFTRYNYYDYDGNLSSATIIYDDPDKNNREYKFTSYTFDSHGNWISRKANGVTQTRTIDYY